MMFRSLTTVLALITSIALFLTFTQPTFKETQAIQGNVAEYVAAMKTATELQARVATLISQRNSFSENDLSRLNTFLPDDVNEVDAVVALDSLAKKHLLSFGNILISSSEIDTSKNKATSTSEGGSALERNLRAHAQALNTGEVPPDVVDTSGAPQGGTPAEQSNFSPVTASFSVIGSYDDFRQFIVDIEQSLLFMDVTNIMITQSDEKKNLMTFQVGVSLYEFKPRI